MAVEFTVTNHTNLSGKAVAMGQRGRMYVLFYLW